MHKNFLQVLFGLLIFLLSDVPAKSVNRFIVHSRAVDVEEGYRASRIVFRGRELLPSETVTEVDMNKHPGGQAATFWFDSLTDPGPPSLPNESYVAMWDRIVPVDKKSNRILGAIFCLCTCGVSLICCCNNDYEREKNVRKFRGQLPQNPADLKSEVHIWYSYNAKTKKESLSPSAGLRTPLLP